MNKKEIYLSFFLFAVAFVVLLVTLYPYRPYSFDEKSTTIVIKTPTLTPIPSASPVIIFSPNLSLPLKSPQKIIGMIDKSWVFEASFPLELFDSQHKSLYKGTASAPNWLDEDSKYTDFTANLKFTTTLENGFLKINNDNPSGLSQNEKSILIPVKLLTK